MNSNADKKEDKAKHNEHCKLPLISIGVLVVVACNPKLRSSGSSPGVFSD